MINDKLDNIFADDYSACLIYAPKTISDFFKVSDVKSLNSKEFKDLRQRQMLALAEIGYCLLIDNDNKNYTAYITSIDTTTRLFVSNTTGCCNIAWSYMKTMTNFTRFKRKCNI